MSIAAFAQPKSATHRELTAPPSPQGGGGAGVFKNVNVQA